MYKFRFLTNKEWRVVDGQTDRRTSRNAREDNQKFDDFVRLLVVCFCKLVSFSKVVPDRVELSEKVLVQMFVLLCDILQNYQNRMRSMLATMQRCARCQTLFIDQPYTRNVQLFGNLKHIRSNA
jgi:hypothetical protein